MNFGLVCVEQVGGFEVGTPVSMEPPLKYHPDYSEVLT